MKFENQTILITGGAQGIGFALSKKFSVMGANVVIADIHKDTPNIAKNFGGFGYICDVTREEELNNFITFAEDRLGGVHCFISNAGKIFVDPDHIASASNKTWELSWKLHVMSHVYAAKYLLPNMINRNQGYFLQIISAAALLSQIGDAAYSASKSAALSFAESLAINNGHLGIKVSAVCPQYIATPMLGMDKDNFTKNKNLISTQTAARRILSLIHI